MKKLVLFLALGLLTVAAFTPALAKGSVPNSSSTGSAQRSAHANGVGQQAGSDNSQGNATHPGNGPKVTATAASDKPENNQGNEDNSSSRMNFVLFGKITAVAADKSTITVQVQSGNDLVKDLTSKTVTIKVSSDTMVWVQGKGDEGKKTTSPTLKVDDMVWVHGWFVPAAKSSTATVTSADDGTWNARQIKILNSQPGNDKDKGSKSDADTETDIDTESD